MCSKIEPPIDSFGSNGASFGGTKMFVTNIFIKGPKASGTKILLYTPDNKD